MSFTNGKPHKVTELDLKAKWYAGKPGEYFRCGICGYKFQLGDIYRFLFTNDLPGYGGNPLVCSSCDGPDVIDKWKENVDLWKTDRFWFFRR